MNTSLVFQIITLIILIVLIILSLCNNIKFKNNISIDNFSPSFSPSSNTITDDSKIILNNINGDIETIKISDLKSNFENKIKDTINNQGEDICSYIESLNNKLLNDYNTILDEYNSILNEYDTTITNETKLLSKNNFACDSGGEIYVYTQLPTQPGTTAQSNFSGGPSNVALPHNQIAFGKSPSGNVSGYLNHLVMCPNTQTEAANLGYAFGGMYGGSFTSGCKGDHPIQPIGNNIPLQTLVNNNITLGVPYHIVSEAPAHEDTLAWHMWNSGNLRAPTYAYHKIDPDIMPQL
jgi:hypothetical protein